MLTKSHKADCSSPCNCSDITCASPCPIMDIHAALGSVLLKTFLDWPYAVQAIIYVVDSSDTERIGTSAEEFHAILDEEELRDALILVYANKQASALTCAQQMAMQSPGNILGHAHPLGHKVC